MKDDARSDGLVFFGATGVRGELGASASLKALQQKFCFHPDQVMAAAREQLGRR